LEPKEAAAAWNFSAVAPSFNPWLRCREASISITGISLCSDLRYELELFLSAVMERRVEPKALNEPFVPPVTLTSETRFPETNGRKLRKERNEGKLEFRE